MRKFPSVHAATLALVLGCVVGAPLSAQHPTEGTEWMISNLRPAGQPVIPIFDGWYRNPDGTFNLCFGYFNLNTEETVEIPVGPENTILPAVYDGKQPTTFLPVPPPPNLYRRYFCTFTVTVPADFGIQRVVWTLVQDGKAYSVPGHIETSSYEIEEIFQRSRNSFAPVVRFEPNGPEGVGRSGLNVGPLTTRVGQPLPLAISVQAPPQYEGLEAATEDGGGRGPTDPRGRREWWLKWAKHQGPGSISFSQGEAEIFTSTPKTASTTATFDTPGRYVIRLQVIDTPGEGGSYQFHCCWTNAFVEVDVSP